MSLGFFYPHNQMDIFNLQFYFSLSYQILHKKQTFSTKTIFVSPCYFHLLRLNWKRLINFIISHFTFYDEHLLVIYAK